jgi:hypothetical protein
VQLLGNSEHQNIHHEDLNFENMDILEQELQRSTNAGAGVQRGFIANFNRNDSSIQRHSGSYVVTSSDVGGRPASERNLTLSRML